MARGSTKIDQQGRDARHPTELRPENEGRKVSKLFITNLGELQYYT